MHGPHGWTLFAFESYPTQTLKPTSVLVLVDTSVPEALLRVNQYMSLAMVNFATLVLPTHAEIEHVLNAAAHGPCSAQTLVQGIETSRQAFVLRSLAWLLKLGVLRLA